MPGQRPPRSPASALRKVALLSAAVIALAGAVAGPPAAQAHAPGKIRVAILSFTTQKQEPRLKQYGQATEDNLYNKLMADQRFQVVDPSEIQHALKKLRVDRSKLIDMQTAASLGEAVQAQLALTGYLQLAGKQIRLVGYVIDVKTVAIRHTEQLTGMVDKIFELEDQLVTGIVRSETGETAAAPQPAPPSGPVAPAAASAAPPALVTSNPEAKEHFQRAMELVEAKNYLRASSELQAAIKLTPDDPLAHYRLAQVYNWLGLKNDAIQELETTLRLDFRHGPATELMRKIRQVPSAAPSQGPSQTPSQTPSQGPRQGPSEDPRPKTVPG